MENDTAGGYMNHVHVLEYKVSMVMWKVCPPFIIALGVFGNVSTILVMNRLKDGSSSQYVILKVLAVADLGVLYVLLDLWTLFTFNWTVQDVHVVPCKLFNWGMYVSFTSSAWLVTAVTVQRTMAVLWPHRMRAMCTVRKTRVVVAVLVCIAGVLQLHRVFGYYLVWENICSHSGKYSQFLMFVWHWVDMGMSSLAPSTCLIVCSVLLSRTLFKSTSVSSTAVSATSNDNAGHRSSDGRKGDAVKVTVMVLALSYTFLILTLPEWAYVLWVTYGFVYTPQMEAWSSLIQVVTYLMTSSNSAINFFLYCLTGSRFRQEFLSLLRCGAKGRSAGETTSVTPRGGESKQ